MEDRRGAMRQDGARAAGEDGGHVKALAGEQLLRHKGVDGLVDAVKAAAGETRADRRRRHPELAQLLEPEDGVLGERERGQSLVERRCLRLRFSSRLGHGTQGSPKTCDVSVTPCSNSRRGR
jgi:hypothetical protein